MRKNTYHLPLGSKTKGRLVEDTNGSNIANTQIVAGVDIIPRATDYHIILVRFKSRIPKRSSLLLIVVRGCLFHLTPLGK
jgi:hypothetical protein